MEWEEKKQEDAEFQRQEEWIRTVNMWREEPIRFQETMIQEPHKED